MYDIKFYLLNPSGGTILKGKQMNKKLWLASGLACAILLAFIFTSSDRPAEAVEAYAAEISEAMSEPAGEARERRKAEIAEKFSPQFCELMADDSLDDSDRAYFAHQAMALSRLLKKPSDALFKVREYMSATFPIEDAKWHINWKKFADAARAAADSAKGAESDRLSKLADGVLAALRGAGVSPDVAAKEYYPISYFDFLEAGASFPECTASLSEADRARGKYMRTDIAEILPDEDGEVKVEAALSKKNSSVSLACETSAETEISRSVANSGSLGAKMIARKLRERTPWSDDKKSARLSVSMDFSAHPEAVQRGVASITYKTRGAHIRHLYSAEVPDAEKNHEKCAHKYLKDEKSAAWVGLEDSSKRVGRDFSNSSTSWKSIYSETKPKESKTSGGNISDAEPDE